MRRRKRTTGTGIAGAGAGPTRKGKKTSTIEEVESEDQVRSSDVEMSVTAMDVVDTTTHHYFGHGHHHLLPGPPPTTTTILGERETTTSEMDLVPVIQNSKAVGARKRKPTQISKIVDKPSSEAESIIDDNGVEEPTFPSHNNNNNNSPPYKKPYIQNSGGERNGMIQNIVTELKSAKKATSSKLDTFFPSHSTQSVIDEDFSSEDDSNSLIEINEERLKDKKKRKERRGTNQRRDHEEKVDLANIHTLLSSKSESKDEGDEDEDGVDMRRLGNEAEDDDDHQLPFRCGVCHFGTLDRVTLVRHMKGHSGERSFQCRLCCFAFTTKANCERHLRKRHGQIDKDQIRNLVILFSSSSSESEIETNGGHHQSQSPSSSSIPTTKNATSGGLLLQHKEKNFQKGSENGQFNLIGRYNEMSRGPVISPPTMILPLLTMTDDDQPLDLSMDVVDLSTKARGNNFNGNGRPSLLRPRPIYPTAEIPNLLVTSPFVTKREPMVHPQMSLPMFGDEQYNGLFNGYSPFSTNAIRAPDLSGPTPSSVVPPSFSFFSFGGTPPYNPFSFPTPALEKIGPGLNVGNITSTKVTPAFPAPSPPTSFESRESLPTSLEKEVKLKSVKKEPKPQTTESSSVSSASPTTTSRKRADPKSGEYQKPKQRRYRTERPFSCPHCAARFTLRSNMERHGKHQHPDIWQRSPSNRVINRQQKSQQSPLAGGPPTMVHSTKYVSNTSGGDVKPKNRSSCVNGETVSNVDVRAVIAQQLKRKLSNSALLNGTGGESESESENNGTETSHGVNDSSDLASVSQLLDRVKNSNIAQYFNEHGATKSITNSEDNDQEDMSGTESSPSGCSSDEGDADETEEVNDNGEKADVGREKKKSAYSSAPHKISCPHCTRRFPWTSSLRRHLLTHTGQKPYQCSQCPLLFTTKSNCDRHLARKHSGKGKSGSGYNTTEDDEDDGEEEGRIQESRGDEEEEDGEENGEVTPEVNEPVVTPPRVISLPSKAHNISANSSPGEDVSFRCHMCEAAATEREVLLAHMEEIHNETFNLLVSKGALTSSPPSENSEAEPQQTISLDSKEATNRKVMCVFCVRRFWSVEDLRRHIRSHSGERPFSCPHCSRRFTLKHSMLRHLKKHVVEDLPNATPRARRENSKKNQQSSTPKEKPTETEESNLISRLLGIHDEGLVEQLLNKPDAKDAAKLLGLRMGLARQNTSLTSSN